ncbi:MAG: transcriptional regulator, partial [Frondihabitans sp.]|nr:transcriptional regulator [Frondihabitans sp.]
RFGISLAEIARLYETLPADRPPSRADWHRISAEWDAHVETRILELTRMRENLSGCIGCGCLSLGTCGLLNPDDALADEGPGPVRTWT